MTHRRKGFSLLEVLFATFLVALAALVMSAALPLGSLSRQKADLTVKASALVHKQLEHARAIGYPNLTAARLHSLGLISSMVREPYGYPFTSVDAGRGDAVSSVLPNGQGWLDLYDIGMDLKSVIVTVRWTERGRTRMVRMATMVGNL